MFLDRGTRLTMPAMMQEDAEEEEEAAKAYTMAEILKIEEIFKGGNCYTAYLLGFYLGVRIAECFALRWSDIDWDKKTITVNKQMLYQDGNFCLVPVKTLTSSRVIDMPEVLSDYLKDKELLQGMGVPKSAYRNTEKVLDKTKAGKVETIVGGDFINRKENGELLTINSIKYWTVKIKKETGIEFKFHGLRKTHATIMASQNTPVLELMGRLGHKKYSTTVSYYINQNLLAREQLKRHINNIDILLDTERQSIEEGKRWYEGLSDFEKGLFEKLSDSEKAEYAQSAKEYVPEPREDNLDKFLEEYEASLKK